MDDCRKPCIHIVLVHPEIPQNTGTIGRLCVCTDAALHLVKPLGFLLDEAHLRRAGLDYWPFLNLSIHEDWDDFLATCAPPLDRMVFCSTKTTRSLYDFAFREGDWIVFGICTRRSSR